MTALQIVVHQHCCTKSLLRSLRVGKVTYATVTRNPRWETGLCHRCHNEDMAVRTTVDIPEPLHDELRHRAHQTGTSVRALIIHAIEQAYNCRKTGDYVTAPLIKGRGKLGPRFPKDENPHDLAFS